MSRQETEPVTDASVRCCTSPIPLRSSQERAHLSGQIEAWLREWADALERYGAESRREVDGEVIWWMRKAADELARLSGLQDTLAATEARFFGQRRVLIEFMAFGTELLRDNWLEDREAERMIDLIATARANFDLALNTDGEAT